MKRIKLYSIVSIDGFAGPSDGSVDWIAEAKLPRDMEYGIHSFYKGIDTVVMTLSHYLSLVSCELLGPHMEKPCIIVRPRADLEVSSMHRVDYITDSDHGFSMTAKYLSELKATGEGDIWIAGDNRLIQSLLEAGVVDEVIITMIPVSLGRGLKPFTSDFEDKNKWRAVRVTKNEYGVAQVHYRSTELENEKIIS